MDAIIEAIVSFLLIGLIPVVIAYMGSGMSQEARDEFDRYDRYQKGEDE